MELGAKGFPDSTVVNSCDLADKIENMLQGEICH